MVRRNSIHVASCQPDDDDIVQSLKGVTITKNSLTGSRNAVGDSYELYLDEGACQQCLYQGLNAGVNWWGQGTGPSVATQENQCKCPIKQGLSWGMDG